MLTQLIETILVTITLAKSTDTSVLYIVYRYLQNYLQLFKPTELIVSIIVIPGI